MLAELDQIVTMFNTRRYDECMSSLQSMDLASERSAEALVSYHGLYGKVCYMLGLLKDAQASVDKAIAMGGGDYVADLSTALDDIRSLIAQTPAPFNTDEWARDKQVLRIGGALPRAYQPDLAHAARLFDTNSQPGYTKNVDLLLDAHRMPMLKDEEFDVVCSSHTMEHLVNPLLALQEWRRVLKPGGYIMSVIPNREKTFDHKRPLTTLQHLIDDYHSGRTEIDWHHVLEFLREHDIQRDGVYKGNKQAHFNHLIKAPQYNVHNHVFDQALVYVMHEYAGFKTIGCFEADIAVYYFGQKPAN